MRLRYWSIWCGSVCRGRSVISAAPQSASDSDIRAREYMQFLVQQLDQWTRDLPQAYNMAMVRPPVDVTCAFPKPKRPGQGSCVKACSASPSLSQVKDLPVNPAFRAQLERTVQVGAPVNTALANSDFRKESKPLGAQIRTTLNSLAAIYKYPELAVSKRPVRKRTQQTACRLIPAGAVVGYVVDQRCAAMGKSMWTNAACVQKCVRDGDKVVFVTEQGKVLQFASPEKIDADSYGQKVAVTGKTDGDTITVATLQIL